MSKNIPSMDAWLKEAKQHESAKKIGAVNTIKNENITKNDRK